MTKFHHPCVLTIAGTDPSGGAGIQADTKAISATGSYATSVITALVAQNTQGVQSIQAVSADFIDAQINSVFNDIDISAVKIGMLFNEEIIETVARALERLKPKNIVLDPVMVAKNGCPLLPEETLIFLKQRLFPLVHLITPNLFEAEKIMQEKIDTQDKMVQAAKQISEQYHINTLMKGGHLNSIQADDVLYEYQTNKHLWYYANRITTENTHGTGCTLSSAIASFLAQDYPMHRAIDLAKQYLTKAIVAGSAWKIGQGHGPVNHFYFI